MFFKHFKSHISLINNHLKSKVVPCRNIKFYNCLQNYSFSKVTAGILIIGDEILKGTPDINTPFLIKQFNALNVRVAKVAIVPDNVDAIAREVCELSSKYSYVITSGGIGPTHDDVTYEAVAKACNDELHLNEKLFKLIINYFGARSENNPAVIKYATVPRTSEVKFVDIRHKKASFKYPIVSVKNIYMFPGVPVILQKSFNEIKSRFMVQNKIIFSKEILIDLDEFSVVSTLNKAVEKFQGYVKFGSYPTFTNNYYKIKLVLESSYNDHIDEAHRFLKENLPEGIVDIKEDVLTFAKKDVYSFSKNLPCAATALSILEETVRRYSLSELCVCFNGDKECTVLLHMLYACVQHLKPKEWNQVYFLYIRYGNGLPEVEMFIQNCADLYNFNLITIDGDLKHSISAFLRSHPNIKALLMGMTKCDTNSCDSVYLSIIKILPLLKWTNSDVWLFLRQLQIPYCVLYDHGYTSISDKSG